METTEADVSKQAGRSPFILTGDAKAAVNSRSDIISVRSPFKLDTVPLDINGESLEKDYLVRRGQCKLNMILIIR